MSGFATIQFRGNLIGSVHVYQAGSRAADAAGQANFNFAGDQEATAAAAAINVGGDQTNVSFGGAGDDVMGQLNAQRQDAAAGAAAGNSQETNQG